MTTRVGAPVGISGTIIRHWMLCNNRSGIYNMA